MKKLLLLAGATGVALGLVIAGAAGARSQATRVQIAATMVAGEETPTPKGDVTAARGSFTGTLTNTDSGTVLNWQLSFGGLTGDGIAAHIHIASRGVAGPVVVPLCTPCTSGATGTANITATMLDAIQTDKPKGNVRRARGAFTVTITKQGSSAVLVWRLTFSRLTGKAFAAHIHSGARGKAGPVIVTLCTPCRTGARGRVTVNASVLGALQSGRTYVNVHTTKNPAGEIRGQLGAAALTLS